LSKIFTRRATKYNWLIAWYSRSTKYFKKPENIIEHLPQVSKTSGWGRIIPTGDGWGWVATNRKWTTVK
jgi:hypothetical protein